MGKAHLCPICLGVAPARLPRAPCLVSLHRGCHPAVPTLVCRGAASAPYGRPELCTGPCTVGQSWCTVPLEESSGSQSAVFFEDQCLV